MEHVFDPTSPPSRKEREPDWGCRGSRIVGRLGGAVTVESELGKGVPFTCIFLWSRGKPGRSSGCCPNSEAGTHSSVDDEKSVLNAAKSMLEYLGYRVTPEHRR